MSSVSVNTTFSKLLVESIRSAAMHSYPSVYMPQEDVKQPEKISVYRVGEMVEKQLTPESLAVGAIQLLSDVKHGVIGKLSAGTGVGKSTRVPLQFAKQLGTVVLIVCPNHQMAQTVGEYVASSLNGGSSTGVSVVVAKCAMDVGKVVAPAVVYMGATEFWFSIYERRGLLKDKGVGVVCFDEAHERVPQYVLAAFMVTTGVFATSKVFMMSATATGDRLEIRPAGVKHEVLKKDLKLLNYEHLDELDHTSPLHYSAMVKPTLIFLPDDFWVDNVEKYYDENAVMVFKLRSDASATEFQALNDKLAKVTCAAVVLATQKHQTCYTFNLSCVVDCGVTTLLCIDEDTGAMSVKEVLVTDSDRVQRCGRVGRFKSGRAVCVASNPRDDNYELLQCDYMYLALWAKLFNVTLKLPHLLKWNKVVESLEPACLRILLTAKVHPWLLINYLTPDGCALSGLKHCFSLLLGVKHAVKSSGGVLAEADSNRWYSRSLRPGLLPVGSTNDYLVPCDLPLSWSVLAYALHCGMSGYSLKSLLSDGFLVPRNRRASTVVSSAMSMLSSSSVDTNAVPAVVGSLSKRLSLSELEPSDSVSVVANKGSSSRDVVEKLLRARRDSIFTTVTGGASLPTYKSKATKSVAVTADGRRFDVTGGMVDEIVDDKRVERKSQRGQTSKSGSVVVSTELKKRIIRADALQYERVRPYNDAHMSLFVRMRSNDECVAYYRDLKYCRTEIASMTAAELRDYYVAVITVWNRKVSNRLQHKAAPFVGFLADTRNDRFYDKIDTTLRRCKGFLTTFEHHGLVLAQLLGCEQIGDTLPEFSEHPGIYEAEWVLSMGCDKFRSGVQTVSHAIQRFCRSDGKSGCYIVMGRALYTIKHVVVIRDASEVSLEFPRHDIRSAVIGDIVELRLTTQAMPAVVSRRAIVDEFVIVVTKDADGVCFKYGVYRIINVGVLCEYTAVLFDGASGSAVVAVDDGALLGFHYGVVSVFQGGAISSFVPILH